MLTGPTGRLSLILPLSRGTVLSEPVLAGYRRLLEARGAAIKSVEVIITGAEEDLAAASGLDGREPGRPGEADVRLVSTDAEDWSQMARAGLSVATGDHLMVLDVERHYASGIAARACWNPSLSGEADLAVAVPPRGRISGSACGRSGAGLGLASRMVLGSSDVFSGLFVLSRSLWERGGRHSSPAGPAWSWSCSCAARPVAWMCRCPSDRNSALSGSSSRTCARSSMSSTADTAACRG